LVITVTDERDAMRQLATEIKKVLLQDALKPMLFGDLIYKIRKDCGLCLMKTAELMGMYFTRLRYLENNMFSRLPKRSEIDLIAQFYEIEPEFLWNRCLEFVRKREFLEDTIPDFKLMTSHRSECEKGIET
jgi:hypothetical protein